MAQLIMNFSAARTCQTADMAISSCGFYFLDLFLHPRMLFNVKGVGFFPPRFIFTFGPRGTCCLAATDLLRCRGMFGLNCFLYICFFQPAIGLGNLMQLKNTSADEGCCWWAQLMTCARRERERRRERAQGCQVTMEGYLNIYSKQKSC